MSHWRGLVSSSARHGLIEGAAHGRLCSILMRSG